MTSEFDPRAWNLFAGLALAAGCGGRTISAEGDATDSINDGESTQNPDSGPECITENDCPYGYYCYNGMCEYVRHHDGHIPNYECYTDNECGQLELCEFNYCQGVGTPPICDIVVVDAPPFELSEPVLQIAFVDVDDDGADELVAVTQTQLHVYETGATMPVSHPRGIESPAAEGMVGGAFDDMPGEDVIVLHDSQLDLHTSDGLGNLAPAVPSMGPYNGMEGLQAGAFDMAPRTDLLVWGGLGSGVVYDGGVVLDLGGNYQSADARDLGQPGSGFTLLRDGDLHFMDLDGVLIGSRGLPGNAPLVHASFDALGTPLEIGGGTYINGWTWIGISERPTSVNLDAWGVLGTVTRLRAGDLDGLDEIDEVALIIDGGLSLYMSNECLLPLTLAGPANDVVFGDHDGDGDDELAVHTGTNFVSLIDVE